MVSIWRRESHLGSKIMAQSCPVRKNVKNIRRCQIASSKTSGTFKTPEFWCKDTGNSCARHLISAIRGSVHCTCTCSEEIFVPIGISRFVAINAMKHVHCDTIVKLKSQEHMSFLAWPPRPRGPPWSPVPTLSHWCNKERTYHRSQNGWIFGKLSTSCWPAKETGWLAFSSES